MNNFTKRLIFGIIYVVLIIVATTTNNYVFSSLFYIFMLFCTYEFNKMQNVKSLFPYIINSLISFLGIVLIFNIINENNNVINILSIFLLLSIFGTFIFYLFSKEKNTTNTISTIILSAVYVGLPFNFVYFIHNSNPDIHGATYRINLVLSVFILLWINDTFAYLVGRKFGKHKLFERVSPKKTIEGFIGGLIFTLIFGIILAKINVLQMQDSSLLYNFKMWIIIALIVSVFGTIGDLIESMFKRQANIKDSSNLIPGHGGFLDRLDSFIFAIPFIFIYLILFS